MFKNWRRVGALVDSSTDVAEEIRLAAGAHRAAMDTLQAAAVALVFIAAAAVTARLALAVHITKRGY